MGWDCPIPFSPMGYLKKMSHPIYGMGWDGMGLSHPIRSPDRYTFAVLSNVLNTKFISSGKDFKSNPKNESSITLTNVTVLHK
jgi:hypothetical protein